MEREQENQEKVEDQKQQLLKYTEVSIHNYTHHCWTELGRNWPSGGSIVSILAQFWCVSGNAVRWHNFSANIQCDYVLELNSKFITASK